MVVVSKGIYHLLVVLIPVLRVRNVQVKHNRQAKDHQGHGVSFLIRKMKLGRIFSFND
jgi:hypothetical protein